MGQIIIRFLTSCVITFALVAFAATSEVASKDQKINAWREDPAIQRRIRRVEDNLLPAIIIKGHKVVPMTLADRLKHYKTPGVSIAVVNRGTIEWARGFGLRDIGNNKPVTPETLFQAGSISKAVASMGAMWLVQQNRLSLDGNVNDALTTWQIPDNDLTRTNKVTLRGLLSHSSGLGRPSFKGYLPGQSLPTLGQVLNGEKPANNEAVRVELVPRTAWRYSGGGYTVVQLLVTDVTGEPFQQFMNRVVFENLGMSRSTYAEPLPSNLWANAAIGYDSTGQEIEGKWYTYPEMAAAGLWTTSKDLCRFLLEIQKSLKGQSNKVLSRETTKLWLTPQIAHWSLGFDLKLDMGLNSESGEPLFSHSGADAGYQSILVGFTNLGEGAVVMANGENGGYLENEIILSIAKEYGWPSIHSVERTLARIDPAIYPSYAGEYEITPGYIASVSTRKHRLYISVPPFFAPSRAPDVLEMYPESESRFFTLEGGALGGRLFTFVRDGNGAVTEMHITAGDTTRHAKKIK
jgi:CubicO group peptidase (beta-lactamase class C family)